MDETQKAELIEKFENMPKKIFDKEVNLFSLSDELDELGLKEKLLEQQVYQLVEDEVDEEKKKVFSNMQKREIETNRRLGSNKEHLGLTEVIIKKRRVLDTEKLLVSFLKRKFRAGEMIVKIMEMPDGN